MKVGTDAMLLGAWANSPASGNIVDVGTGCGILALMMAQRTNCYITAIDIDEHSIAEASENFRISPWNSRIIALQCDVVSFAEIKPFFFDFVICNPPYFINSLLPLNKARKATRHLDSLQLKNFIAALSHLLQPEGILALIVPYDHKELFINTLCSSNLHIVRQTEVYGLAHTKPIRVMLELSRVSGESEGFSQLAIYESHSRYSKDYIGLMSDFLLNF